MKRLGITSAAVVLSAAVILSAARDLPAQEETQHLARGPAFLIAASPAPARLDVMRTPVLRQRISIDLRGLTLDEALAAVSRESGLQLSFSNAVIPTKRRVELRADSITVAAVLTELLVDIEVDILFQRNGRAVLIRRTEQQSVALQQTGAISGRVTDSITNEAIAGVTISVEGTRLATTTSSEGRYTIASVPVGARTVSARRLGYARRTQVVTVVESASVTADLVLVRVPTQLTEIVVTPTGDRQRLEVGNAIGTIKADSIVPYNLIRNVSDLLTARTTGVIVTNTTGDVGAPSKIRIRGVGSVLLNNDPIVIVDGVRQLSQVSTARSQVNLGPDRIIGLGDGPFAPSRLDDLDPTIIESIDVVRGPSAASLYGTEAANGVIVIKTKRGRPGAWRADFMADKGVAYLPEPMPPMYLLWGHQANGTITAHCQLTSGLGKVSSNVADGTCIPDSLQVLNSWNDPDLTTIGRGSSNEATMALSGGSDQLSEYLSLRSTNNVGLTKMSAAESRRLSRMWGSPPPYWMKRPNAERALNGSSRTSINRPRADLSINATGVYRNVRGGNVATLAPGSLQFDSLSYLPSEQQRPRVTSVAKRGGVSLSGNIRPNSWLALRGTIGGDYALRSDDLLIRSSDCTAELNPNGCSSRRTIANNELFVVTADLGATVNASLAPWLGTTTAFGQQYTNARFNGLRAGNESGTNLAFGTELLTPSPVLTETSGQLFSVSESRDQGITAGWYVEETARMLGRYFLTAGLRRDVASAFGRDVNVKAPIYPKISASWLVSGEPRFPWRSTVPGLRIRAAYGQSGRQAGQAAILPEYSQSLTMASDATASGLVTSTGIRMLRIGNPNLKPERTSEWEAGFDLSLFDNERIKLEGTAYRKLSSDAIMNITLPASIGLRDVQQTVNIGAVENRGVEATFSARILDLRVVAWDAQVMVTQNSNKLVKKSDDLVDDVRAEHREGYPIFSFFRTKLLSYADLDGDGILAFSEMVFSDTAVFQGTPYPKRELTYLNTLSAFRGRLRLSASISHVVDQTTFLTTTSGGGSGSGIADVGRRCLVDTRCSLGQQALAMQGSAGYYVPSSSVRLSELSLNYDLPPRITRLLRANSGGVTVAGRNLALWTDYAGLDPNIDNANSLGEVPEDYGTSLPQPRNWTFRLRLGY